MKIEVLLRKSSVLFIFKDDTGGDRLTACLVTVERFIKPCSYLHCHSFLLYSLDLGTLRLCDNMVVHLHTEGEQRNEKP